MLRKSVLCSATAEASAGIGTLQKRGLRACSHHCEKHEQYTSAKDLKLFANYEDSLRKLAIMADRGADSVNIPTEVQ